MGFRQVCHGVLQYLGGPGFCYVERAVATGYEMVENPPEVWAAEPWLPVCFWLSNACLVALHYEFHAVSRLVEIYGLICRYSALCIS